jgi:hypothetical protein
MRTSFLRSVAGAALVAFAATAAPVSADDEPAKAPEEPAKAPEEPTRGFVGYGVGFVQGLSEDERKQHGITRENGLYVTEVGLGSPAATAGLKPGDVLLSLNGKPLPDASKVDPKDDASKKAFFDGEWKTTTHAVMPGDAVELEVERKGERTTVKTKAVSKKLLDELRLEAEEEEQSVKVPDPTRAGPANAASFSFEGLEEDVELPEDVLQVTGWWRVEPEPAKPANRALRQQSNNDPDRALAVITGDGRSLVDGTVTVRFAPLKGGQFVGGGVAFRVKDRLHYDAAIVDGVTRTFRLVTVEKKKAKVHASVEIPSPKLGSWHVIEVTLAGAKIAATLDGGSRLETTVGMPSTGWVGLYSELDGDTLFDDLKIVPK